MPDRFKIAGYSMELFSLNGAREIPRKFIAVAIDGRIDGPVIAGKFEPVYSRGARLEGDAMVFLAVDEGERDWRYVEGIELEWKHISELVPGEPLEKEMWYSHPYYSFKVRDKTYRVRFWLVGQEVDCGIHDHLGDSPNFKELHLQLRGSGYMEVFQSGRKVMEVPMEPGRMHCPFYVVKQGRAVYPPHQYRSGPEGALFMVFEELCE